MTETLQYLKNLLRGIVFKELSRWISLMGVIFSLQDVFGYTPGSISGKYQFIEIGSGFYYNDWMPKMKTNWGSEAAVRESFAPSAMVDWDGDLYTIHVSGFDSSGIKLCLKKNQNGSTTKTKEFYPWLYIPNTTVSGKVTTDPKLTESTDPDSFKNSIHNAFMPTLVQETDEASGYLRMFLAIPPTRYMNATCTDANKDPSSSIEGMMSLRFVKDLESNPLTAFYYHNQNGALWFCRTACRYISGHKYPVINSNYASFLWAGVGASSMWLYYFAGENSKKSLYYIRVTTKLGEEGNGSAVCKTNADTGGNNSDHIKIASRFIKKNGYVYFMSWMAGYYVDLLMRDLSEQYRRICILPGIYTETYTSGAEPSPYDYDFCILNNPATNTLSLGALSFGGNNEASYATLKTACNWTSTYCNWTVKNISLVLRSSPLSTGTDYEYISADDWYTAPQNIIYTTDITWGNGTACDLADTSKEDSKRFYLNTHRICTDVTNSDCKYLFYCYCYPGKKTQLYLGYARYYFDSNNRILLGPKCEFRASASQWSDSFGNFTSCSRIISMDCKNGHLWITWMNADNTKYYAFHILVKDLVGE